MSALARSPFSVYTGGAAVSTAHDVPAALPGPCSLPPSVGSWTIYEVMRHFPLSILTFRDFGIDTWDGALQTVAGAADAVAVPLDALLAALVPCTVEDEDASLEASLDDDLTTLLAASTPDAPGLLWMQGP